MMVGVNKLVHVYLVLDFAVIVHVHTHTHTAMQVDINLQDICITVLSSWLKSADDANTLPLPRRIRERLIQFIND